MCRADIISDSPNKPFLYFDDLMHTKSLFDSVNEAIAAWHNSLFQDTHHRRWARHSQSQGMQPREILLARRKLHTCFFECKIYSVYESPFSKGLSYQAVKSVMN